MRKKVDHIINDIRTSLDKASKEIESKVDFDKIQNKFDEVVDAGYNKLAKSKELRSEQVTANLTLVEEKELITEVLKDVIDGLNIDVSQHESNDELIEFISEEVLGRSVLAEAFEDEEIFEIYCTAWDKIWVETNDDKKVKYSKTFKNKEHYVKTIKRLLAYGDVTIDLDVDDIATIDYFEHRISVSNLVEGDRGLSMTIRKNANKLITISDLIEQGVVDNKVANLFGLLVNGNANFVYGSTAGVGKTTSINAILNGYLPDAFQKIHIVEDSQELKFPNNRVIAHQTNDYAGAEELYKKIYRTDPDKIVIDEIKGPEVDIVVKGMLTGHSVIGLAHGADAESIVERLTLANMGYGESSKADEETAVREIGQTVDFVAIQSAMSDGSYRVTSINEVIYDKDLKKINLNPIMEYSESDDEFLFINTLSPATINKMIRNGVSYEELTDFI